MKLKLLKLPNKNLYRVRLKDTGQILSYATTYENAIKQIRFLQMRDHNLKGGSINHSNIQSVLFFKMCNTIKEADKWLKDHGYKILGGASVGKGKKYMHYIG